MATPNPFVDIAHLHEVEAGYRKRLEQEPGDTGARLRLAWCLVLEALYRDGKESMRAQLLAALEGMDEQSSSQIRALLTATEPAARGARSLLKCCLHQAVIVTQLSLDPEEKRDAERLRTLVRLSGGEEAVLHADDEANRILGEITRALLQPSDEGVGNHRRVSGMRLQ